MGRGGRFLNNYKKAAAVIGIVALSLSLLLIFLIKFFAEKASINYGFDRVNDYAAYFASVSDWISGISVPVFTLISVILLFVTLLMQREELQMQRKELTSTREELTQQNSTMARQRFENTFFRMVTLHSDIVNSLKGKTPGGVRIEGREVFYECYLDYYNFYTFDKETQQLKEDYYNRARVAYNLLFKKHHSTLGHYFRNLYRILKFIDEQENQTIEEKQNYVGIIKAQLSTYELVLLTYNCLSDYGNDKFAPLVKRYNLLDNLDKSILIEEVHYELFYTHS